MQELTKILIFLSTMWGTVSADSTARRTSFTDVTNQGSVNTRNHKNIPEESSVSYQQHSQRLSRKMNQLHYVSPQDIQTDSQTISSNENNTLSLTVANQSNDSLGEVAPSNSSLIDSILQDDQRQSTTTQWGSKKNNVIGFSATIPLQPAWQLPVQKLEGIEKESKKLKILPISSMHELWFATKRILMSDLKKESNLQPKNHPAYESQQQTKVAPISDEYHSKIAHGDRNGIRRTKGDSADDEHHLLLANEGSAQHEIQRPLNGVSSDDELIEAESRGWQNGGMMNGGGGQPILLIKDKGDGGGDMKGDNGMTPKDNIGPLIMMLTPLIMMCIMMPMMMSVMGGMMNFMKGVASIMMMSHMPNSNGMPNTVLTKHRTGGGEDLARGRVFLGSLILEVMDKLEAAFSKYDT